MTIGVAILTASDRAFRRIYEDQSGPLLSKEVKKEGWDVREMVLAPDDKNLIEAALRRLCKDASVSLILTTGGTGIGPRDVTVEATRSVIEKEIPGFGERMRFEGLKHTPLSALSRATAGISQGTLIVNFPGSPKGALQSFSAVRHLIEHALDMMEAKGHEAEVSRA